MPTLDLEHPTPEQNARFNATALEVRHEFNALVERVSEPHTHDIHWIVGSIASRNKYNSPLFIRMCRIAFINAELERDPRIDELSLSDRPLAEFLARGLRKKKSLVRVVCTESFPGRIWRILRPLRQYLIAAGLLLLRFLARSKDSPRRVPGGSRITLIDTFVVNNPNGSGGSLVRGKHNLRHFRGILDHLTAEERREVFFIPTLIDFPNALSAFPQIRSADHPFLVPDDFLNAADYAFLLAHPFRLLSRPIGPAPFRGGDLAPLLRQENLRNCADFISIAGLILYRFSYRLAYPVSGERKIDVRLVVDWSENQVLDRGLVAGFHRFHPGTRIIGYQGHVMARSLHVYTCPNETEWRGGAVPETMYVIGEGMKAGLNEFCKDLRVEVGPGFQFQKLRSPRKETPDPDFYTVLVGLPIDPATSKDVVELLAEAASGLRDGRTRFWIKPHPNFDEVWTRALLGDSWPPEFTAVSGDFNSALERSNLLITTASSIALESLGKGVPVVVAGARIGMDQNPIPPSVTSEMWGIAHTPKEYAAEVGRFREAQEAGTMDFSKIAENIRERFFHPVNRRTVAQFLGLPLGP